MEHGLDGKLIAFRPDKELEDAIVRVANRNKMSKSALIRHVLAKAFLVDKAELEVAK